MIAEARLPLDCYCNSNWEFDTKREICWVSPNGCCRPDTLGPGVPGQEELPAEVRPSDSQHVLEAAARIQSNSTECHVEIY